jgi:hypothetical protein
VGPRREQRRELRRVLPRHHVHADLRIALGLGLRALSRTSSAGIYPNGRQNSVECQPQPRN